MEKLKNWAVKLAVCLAVFTPLFMAISAFGVKFGLWGWKFGFLTLVRGYGVKLLMLTLIVAIIALILSLIVKPRKSWLAPLLALIVPIAGMGFGKYVSKTAQSLPFIHDIMTDTSDVPTFTDAMKTLRKEASNSLDYVGTKVPRSEVLVAAAQAKAYPDIDTLALLDAPDGAFTRSLSAVKSLGLDVVTEDKKGGIIEATATSFWFGFKDDVVIRVRPASGGSLVDIRSVSRHGMSDLGMNAKRIRTLTAKIRE